ncbi:EamA-like transporter family protein [Lysinibacillus fusiformis]|nr:EamA-like transporter family protein [Lysinibacillus fusiformis]
MQRLKGIIFIVSGAMLWGATGPLMEWLLNHTSLTVSFMLTIRLSVAGMILITYLLLTGKKFLVFGSTNYGVDSSLSLVL